MSTDKRTNTATFILLSGIVLAVLLACSSAVGLWMLYRAELVQATKELQRLSLALAEQTTLAFQEIDTTIKQTRALVQPEEVKDVSREMALHRLFRNRFHGLLQGQALLLFDADGRMRAHSREFPTPDVTVGDRGYFRAQVHDGADRLYISKPLRNRVNQHWMISLSRRISGAKGAFAGVIMAAVDMHYFLRLYRSLDLPPEAVIQLRRADGAVLATYPFDPRTLDKVQPACPHPEREVCAENSLGSFPISLLLTVPRSVVLRRWHVLAWMIAPGVLVAVAGIIMLTWGLMVRVRLEQRRSEQQQELLEQQVRQRTAELQGEVDFTATVLAVSPVGIGVYRQDGPCVSVNAVYCRAVGREREMLLGGTFYTAPFLAHGALPEAIRSTLDSGESTQGEEHLDTGLWIEWRLVRFTRHAVIHLMVLVSDISERKQAELISLEKTNALAESEERLRTLINAMPDIVCFKDGEGHFLEASAFALRVFQLEGKPYQGKTNRELGECYPLFREAFQVCEASDEGAWRQGSLWRGEEVIPEPDGGLRTFDMIKVPLFYPDGTRRGLVVVGRDVTEQKFVQSLLHGRMHLNEIARDHPVNDIMRVALDEAEALTGSSIGFFHFLGEDQVTLRLQTWSTNTLSRMCTAEGSGMHYPVDKAGMWVDCIHERRPVIHNDYALLPHRQGLPEGHAPIIREAVVPVIRDGRIDAILGVGNKRSDYTEKDIAVLMTFAASANDMVQRKRAEEGVRRMEALLTSMLRNLPLDFWARDSEGHCLIQSDISRDWWGDLRGLDVEGPSLPEGVQSAWNANNARALAGEVVTDEHAYSLPAGMTVYVQERVAPIREDTGAIIGVMGVNVDLTPQRRLEMELRAAKENAEAASRSKSAFLANMSHEIRTPLNGVLGMLQLLEATALDLEQQEYLHAAIMSSRRLTRLLSDILDLSRIEAGKLSIQHAAFETENLRHAVEDVFGLAAREKGLGLVVHFEPGTPRQVVGDEVRLRQILFNLVGNAIKFTDKGSVRVTLMPLPPPSETRCRLLVMVEDSGSGIADDRLRAIFEPFVQGEGAEGALFQGAGLGLAIVQRLVHLMHGELAIDNGSQGTTMYCSLLLGLTDTPVLPRIEASPVGKAISGVGRSMLLVEDERINRLALKRMLEKMGATVVEAENGRQALEQAEASRFDAIFMDIQMPLLDGMETTRAIRAAEERQGRPPVPIIALTAYAMTGDRERFLAAGMDAYLAKPVEREKLVQVLGRVLARDRADS